MLTKEKVSAFQTEAVELLRELAKKHALTMGPSKASYDEMTFKFNLSFGDAEATNGANPEYVRNFQRYAMDFNITAQLGARFMSGPAVYELVGMKGRSQLVGKRVSGPDAGKNFLIDPNKAAFSA